MTKIVKCGCSMHTLAGQYQDERYARDNVRGFRVANMTMKGKDTKVFRCTCCGKEHT